MSSLLFLAGKPYLVNATQTVCVLGWKRHHKKIFQVKNFCLLAVINTQLFRRTTLSSWLPEPIPAFLEGFSPASSALLLYPNNCTYWPEQMKGRWQMQCLTQAQASVDFRSLYQTEFACKYSENLRTVSQMVVNTTMKAGWGMDSVQEREFLCQQQKQSRSWWNMWIYPLLWDQHIQI